MPLLLTVLRYRNQAPERPLSCQFDAAGGVIGRAPGSDLTLPDESKYISRTHARIICRDGAYLLEDVGSNPSVVNERPLGAGHSIRLTGSETLAIGDYVLSVSLIADPLLSALSPPSVTPAQVLADPLASAGVLNVGPQALGADPLGLNLFGTPPATGQASTPAFRGSENDHLAPELQPFPGMPRPAAMAIPDDYDPLAPFVQAAAAAPAAPAAPPPPLTSGSETIISPAAAVAKPVAAPSEPDAIALAFNAVAATPPPPQVEVPPPARIAPEPAAVNAAPAHKAASGQGAIAPLLAGIGIEQLPRASKSDEEVLQLAGQMLSHAMTGVMTVLRARALMKREIRSEMTIIASRDNNPLKFLPDSQAALAQMLGGSMSGFLPALPAIDGAFDDLKTHELALMSAMREVVLDLLQRFDPANIERQIEAGGMMDKMMSANRKARMWDRFVELHRSSAARSEDDFQRVFGERFTQAYEQALERLRGPR